MIDQNDIVKILSNLAKERPIFHNEKDFQLALAWRIHEECHNLNVRLEKKINIQDDIINPTESDRFFDIFLFNDQNIVIIEIKYKTSKFHYEIDGETFELKEQNARDQGRFDFIKDIIRIERALDIYKSENINCLGFSIMITNDSLYWEKIKNENAKFKDIDFRIHQGKTLKGVLKWKYDPSKGTISGREYPLILAGEYSLNWRTYSDLKEVGLFKYLLVKIV